MPVARARIQFLLKISSILGAGYAQRMIALYINHELFKARSEDGRNFW